MSRIGKMPVKIPKGVTVKVDPGQLLVTGGKDKLVSPLPIGITVKLESDEVHFQRRDDSKQQRSFHGLARALFANNVKGVTDGFKKELDIVGIGYRAQVAGNKLDLNLGFSHPIAYPIPEGIQITVNKNTHLIVSGADRQMVGQVAAQIRRMRPPEPYKGKGIRYTGEQIRRKAGKVGKTTAV